MCARMKKTDFDRHGRKRRSRTNNRTVFMAPSSIHSSGLFARRDVPAGTDLVEYAGPRIPIETGRELSEKGNVFVFDIDRRSSIDGSVPWNLARYANHSCRPNAESVKVNGKIWLRALRSIKKGEEITYDYGFSFKNHKNAICHCGDSECVGFIVHKKYKGKINEAAAVG